MNRLNFIESDASQVGLLSCYRSKYQKKQTPLNNHSADEQNQPGGVIESVQHFGRVLARSKGSNRIKNHQKGQGYPGQSRFPERLVLGFKFETPGLFSFFRFWFVDFYSFKLFGAQTFPQICPSTGYRPFARINLISLLPPVQLRFNL